MLTRSSTSCADAYTAVNSSDVYEKETAALAHQSEGRAGSDHFSGNILSYAARFVRLRANKRAAAATTAKASLRLDLYGASCRLLDRGAESNCANAKTKPARDGATVHPTRRTRAMSSGLGAIQPRLIQARSLAVVSACGSTLVMVGAPDCLFSARLMSSLSFARRFACARACSVCKVGLQAFILSIVTLAVQPLVSAQASRSTRSTFGRSPWSWISSSSTDRFSVMR